MTDIIAYSLFTTFNALRVVSYVPTIICVMRDHHGATGISYLTWWLWVGAIGSLTWHALTNLGDSTLAALSLANGACCLVVIILTASKRCTTREFRRIEFGSDRAPAAPVSISGRE